MDHSYRNKLTGYGVVFALLLACALLSPEAGAATSTTNHAPLFGNAPVTSVKAGSTYSYTPWVWDQDHDVLSFSVVHAPAWATFSPSTGKLSGTPTSADVGTTTGIVITVSDGKTSTSIGPFSVTVVYVNHPPLFGNYPVMSVKAGSAYSFTPLVWDQDRDVLRFSIVHAPTWATFSTSTGRLSGTPTSANVGTTTGVVITVSDGKTSTSMGPFNIAVGSTYTGTGTAVLRWVAPTTRQDGSSFSLSQLRGYRVYKGTVASNLALVATIASSTATSYTVSNLVPGTYYFAVTAYDAAGVQSRYSSIVSKVIK